MKKNKIITILLFQIFLNNALFGNTNFFDEGIKLFNKKNLIKLNLNLSKI